MDLAAVEQAAKVIPVFVRNEKEDQKPVKLDYGHYRCDHLAPLSTRAAYNTVVLFRADDDGMDYNVPLVGFTVNISDSSYKDLSRYHWMRYLISGATGFYGGWTNWGALQDYDTMFVRLFNAFDGEGVQHKHARVNLFDYVEEYEGEEFYAQVFEAHTGRVGLYVDPVEEILQARNWEVGELNRFVHTPYTGDRDQIRIVNYYWNNFKPSRFKQLKAGDTVPEVEPDRMERINAVVQQAARERERREQQRLINAGEGRQRVNFADAARGFDFRNIQANANAADIIEFDAEPPF